MKEKIHATPAIRMLKEHGISFMPQPYRYVDRGGTRVASQALHIEERRAVKTLVMEDERGSPLIILMRGDCQVSTKALAREIGAKSVAPCSPDAVHRHTGYIVGGTSPFGTRKALPVYMEKTILDDPTIFINGGRKGLLIEMDPRDVVNLLRPVLVEVGYRS